jgi:hypothetical protein
LKLWKACRDGIRQYVQAAIAAGADVNFSKRGKSCLYFAVVNSRIEIVELLLTAGAEARTQTGSMALIIADRPPQVSRAVVMLAAGADTGAKTLDGGFTALILAAQYGHDKCVTLLVRSGAGMEARAGADHNTALIFAARNNHSGCAEVLLNFSTAAAKVVNAAVTAATADAIAAEARAAIYDANAANADAAVRVQALESELAALYTRAAADALSVRMSAVGMSTAASTLTKTTASDATAAAAAVAVAVEAAATAATAAAVAAAAEAAENAQCCICLSATKNAAFIPCGHACVCLECGNEIAAQRNATCPVCRTSVTGCMQVFI